MANLYKLTNENGMTRANTTTELQWGVGVTHTAKIEGVRLCSNQVIHAYEHLPIALLIGPGTIKANKPRLWAAEGEIVAREGQLKCGVKTLTTVCEIPLPTITLEQRAKFAILCALEVYKEEDFVCWARKWLSREDRSKSKAQEAAKAADYTARAIRHYHKMQAQIEQQSLEEIAARCGALVASAAWAAKSASEASPLPAQSCPSLSAPARTKRALRPLPARHVRPHA